MFKKIFNKKKILENIETHEQDMALRLMFEIAISDGILDKKELELIKSVQIKFSQRKLRSRVLSRKLLMKLKAQHLSTQQ